MRDIYLQKVDALTYKNANLASGVNLVKTAGGNILGWSLSSTGVAPVFVRFFDTATGADGLEASCLFSISVPISGCITSWLDGGVKFQTGLAINANLNYSGLASPSANSLNAAIFYK